MPKAIMIGASWGGFEALTLIVSSLPASFLIPIVIVQHQYPHRSSKLAGLLSSRSALPVIEAEDKMSIESGAIYVAPPNYHLLIERNECLVLSLDAPVCYSRPSIDVLFESAADVWLDDVVGVLLTGANDDGSDGLLRIARCGGLAIVQEPSTAEAPVMPQAGIDKVRTALVMSVPDIAKYLNDLSSC